MKSDVKNLMTWYSFFMVNASFREMDLGSLSFLWYSRIDNTHSRVQSWVMARRDHVQLSIGEA